MSVWKTDIWKIFDKTIERIKSMCQFTKKGFYGDLLKGEEDNTAAAPEYFKAEILWKECLKLRSDLENAVYRVFIQKRVEELYPKGTEESYSAQIALKKAKSAFLDALKAYNEKRAAAIGYWEENEEKIIAGKKAVRDSRLGDPHDLATGDIVVEFAVGI